MLVVAPPLPVAPVPPVPPVPPPVPAPAPPVAGALGVEVAGAEGGADAEALEPLDADVEPVEPVEPVELVVAVVPVVLVCVVLLGFEAGTAVEVGTVNGGTSELSAVVEPLPQATRPADSAAPLRRATANFRMLVVGAIKTAGDPFACRSAGNR